MRHKKEAYTGFRGGKKVPPGAQRDRMKLHWQNGLWHLGPKTEMEKEREQVRTRFYKPSLWNEPIRTFHKSLGDN